MPNELHLQHPARRPAPGGRGDKLLWLIGAMRRLRLTGVALKDEQPARLPPWIDEALPVPMVRRQNK